jgi:hypothetical protein
MRITIEPTLPGTPGYYVSVQIEVRNDDLDLSEMLEQLVVPALRAIGYAEETIERHVSVDGLTALSEVAE